jgi:hypothetical protein
MEYLYGPLTSPQPPAAARYPFMRQRVFGRLLQPKSVLNNRPPSFRDEGGFRFRNTP